MLKQVPQFFFVPISTWNAMYLIGLSEHNIRFLLKWLFLNNNKKNHFQNGRLKIKSNRAHSLTFHFIQKNKTNDTELFSTP